MLEGGGFETSKSKKGGRKVDTPFRLDKIAPRERKGKKNPSLSTVTGHSGV